MRCGTYCGAETHRSKPTAAMKALTLLVALLAVLGVSYVAIAAPAEGEIVTVQSHR